MSRIFYSGTKNASSWAFRAWLALTEAGIPFEEQVVDIRRPQRYANLAKIAEFSPPGAVPVLVDEGQIIFDSLAIMEYANELGGNTLLPSAIAQRARARSLIAWVHTGMSELCSDISFESAFITPQAALTPQVEADIQRIANILENELRSSGGPYLAGTLSLADLAFTPLIIRLRSRMTDFSAWPLFSAWQERMLARESVKTWMAEAKQLPPVVEAA